MAGTWNMGLTGGRPVDQCSEVGHEGLADGEHLKGSQEEVMLWKPEKKMALAKHR